MLREAAPCLVSPLYSISSLDMPTQSNHHGIFRMKESVVRILSSFDCLLKRRTQTSNAGISKFRHQKGAVSVTLKGVCTNTMKKGFFFVVYFFSTDFTNKRRSPVHTPSNTPTITSPRALLLLVYKDYKAYKIRCLMTTVMSGQDFHMKN